MRQTIGLLTLIIMIVSACNTEAEDPVFFTIGPNKTITDPSQGGNFQKFLYSYVYYQNSAIGVFSQGNNFPIIPDQENKLIVFPGIQKNGISAEPAIYPFMLPDTIEADFQSGNTNEINAVYRYSAAAKFDLNETFEQATNFNYDLDGDNSSKLTIEDNVGYNGSSGGALRVTEDNPNNFVGLDFFFNVSNYPVNQDIYWEMSYRSDVEIVLGLIGTTTVGVLKPLDLIVLRPRLEWNKIYIELSEELKLNNFLDFTPYIKVSHDPQIESAQVVHIDDVKIVHF